MVHQQKLHLITIKHQKILLYMFDNKGVITFKKQKIYSSNNSFKKSMQELVNANYLKIEIDGHHGCNIYRMTLEGGIVAKEVIQDFIKCNS